MRWAPFPEIFIKICETHPIFKWDNVFTNFRSKSVEIQWILGWAVPAWCPAASNLHDIVSSSDPPTPYSHNKETFIKYVVIELYKIYMILSHPRTHHLIHTIRIFSWNKFLSKYIDIVSSLAPHIHTIKFFYETSIYAKIYIIWSHPKILPSTHPIFKQ